MGGRPSPQHFLGAKGDAVWGRVSGRPVLSTCTVRAIEGGAETGPEPAQPGPGCVPSLPCSARAPGTSACTRVVYGTLPVCLGSERPTCGLSTEQSHLPEEVGRSLPRASPGLFASPPLHIPAVQGAWLPTSHLPTQPHSVGTCRSHSQPRVGALSTPESYLEGRASLPAQGPSGGKWGWGLRSGVTPGRCCLLEGHVRGRGRGRRRLAVGGSQGWH